jgi:ATP-binding cassette, subfamily C (CFTR/MRP), member 4
MSNKREYEIPLLDVETHSPKNKSKKTHFANALSSKMSPDRFDINISWFRYYTFLDLWPYINKINSTEKKITSKDLPLPTEVNNVENKLVLLDQIWAEEVNAGSPSLIRSIFKAYKREFLGKGLVMFSVFGGRLITTVLLGKIISAITTSAFHHTSEKDQLMNYAVAFSVVFLFVNVTNTNYWNSLYLYGARIRLTITGLVYKKIQSIALSSLQQLNIGKVINLLANDLNDIDIGYCWYWPLLLSPINLLLSGWLMWEYFGEFTLINYTILLLNILFSQFVSKAAAGPRVIRNGTTDERVKLTNEIIECIRLIKMYAWEAPLRSIISKIRSRELQNMFKLFRIEISGSSISEQVTFLSSFIMFSFYATYSGSYLSPEKVYASMMIMGVVRMWCINMPHQGYVFRNNAKNIEKRITDILNIPDIITLDDTSAQIVNRDSNGYLVELLPVKSQKKEAASIVYRNFTAYWSPDGKKQCLSKITTKFVPGEVVAVIGKIGSGKTTFLLSMLKELPKTEGDLSVKGSIAYVEQEPMIFSGTIQSNILFGRPFDEELYNQVLKASNLIVDLKQFKKQDKTAVGEKGITLSGGQKARLSLARALYSRSDIYLFDDPLSAVDAKVARHIFMNSIRGELTKDKIVILVTHHLSYAKESNRTIVFDQGKILAEGQFEDLQNMQIDLLNIFKKEESEPEKEKENHKVSDTRKKSSVHQVTGETIVEEEPVVPVEKESTVSSQTYKNYLKTLGSYTPLLTVIALYMCYNFCVIGYSRFVGSWAFMSQQYFEEHGTMEGFENTPYIIKGLFILLGVYIFFILGRVMFNHFLLKCNSELHEIMIRKITRAPTAFFDKTPIGSILNRFSNDMGLLDKNNWGTMHFVLWGSCNIIFLLVTISLINPFVMVPSILVIYLLLRIRGTFEKPTTQTKRLDLQSRSPLYSSISETLNGLLMIRVFQQGGRFIRSFMDIIYENSRSFGFMQRVSGVFGLVLDLGLYLLTVSGIFLYIYISQSSYIEPGLFGMALVLLLDICNSSSFIIKQTLQLDVNMQSAERILQYCELDEEAAEFTQVDEQLKNNTTSWPNRGEIVFKNAFMKYGEGMNYALNGLNLVIPAGKKIGVVGRTGAGKSSIIQALFRMVEIENEPNSSITIDGTDIKKLGLNFLRKSLSIIPQTAVIFTGTIRRNLDPFEEFSEKELWNVLEEVNLKKYVSGLEKKLETDMTFSSTVFSAGQKQLICLARAIIRKSKIVILDEATANVDIGTDNFIQEKINEKFKGCSVITVAHRLTTVANYDKILVLDRGMAAEYDHPYLLLVEKPGDSEITKKNGNFVSMVKSSGESMAKKIFEMAYKSYQNS